MAEALNNNNLNNRKFGDYIKIAFSGFAMGVANVIPGVSGGTMAFLLGIYEELIESIRKLASIETFKDIFTFKIKKLFDTLPWRFLLALAIGVGIALVSCSKLFTYLVVEHPVLTFSFFFGLVAASVLAVLKKVKKWSSSRIVMLIIGAVIAYFVISIVPTETPNVWWISLLAGMVVICAMILPGISGSFLLLVLGQYKYVWGAVATLSALGKGVSTEVFMKAFETVVMLGLGCVAGLGSFVHLLNYLFKKFHDLTVATLIGFMVGSLWKLWPWKVIMKYSVKTGKEILQVVAADIEPYKVAGNKITVLMDKNILPPVYDKMFWFALGLGIAGFVLVFVMEYVADKMDTKQSGKIEKTEETEETEKVGEAVN
jgi:putative membrane protein